jgi:hypothetical protein
MYAVKNTTKFVYRKIYSVRLIRYTEKYFIFNIWNGHSYIHVTSTLKRLDDATDVDEAKSKLNKYFWTQIQLCLHNLYEFHSKPFLFNLNTVLNA